MRPGRMPATPSRRLAPLVLIGAPYGCRRNFRNARNVFTVLRRLWRQDRKHLRIKAKPLTMDPKGFVFLVKPPLGGPSALYNPQNLDGASIARLKGPHPEADRADGPADLHGRTVVALCEHVYRHQAAAALDGGKIIRSSAVTGSGCSRFRAATSTFGQNFAGMPRRGQWIASAGLTPIAVARGLTPPNASMTSE